MENANIVIYIILISTIYKCAKFLVKFQIAHEVPSMLLIKRKKKSQSKYNHKYEEKKNT